MFFPQSKGYPGNTLHWALHVVFLNLSVSCWLGWLFLQLLFLRKATSFPILSPEEGKQRLSKGWHRWLTYFCWLLLGVTSLASAFFTALYSLELNKDQATSWVISMILSLLQNTFVSQPAKVREKLSLQHGRKRYSCRKLGKPRSVGVSPRCHMVLTTWWEQKETEMDRVKFVRGVCVVVVEKTKENW